MDSQLHMKNLCIVKYQKRNFTSIPSGGIDLFTSILKESIDVCLHSLANQINCTFEQNELPEDLKLPHLIPFYDRRIL